MHVPSRKFAVAALGGITALALLPGSPAAGGGDAFQATGRPEPTNVFMSPDGPTRFTDRVQVRFDVKIDGRRNQVIKLRGSGGIANATFELKPGDSFPWHVHPGPVLVSVVGGGELSSIRARDCVVRPYAVGSAFVEPGPAPHTAFNQGAETVTVAATFFGVGPGEALSTAASPDKQLRLDDRCDIGTVY